MRLRGACPTTCFAGLLPLSSRCITLFKELRTWMEGQAKSYSSQIPTQAFEVVKIEQFGGPECQHFFKVSSINGGRLPMKICLQFDTNGICGRCLILSDYRPEWLSEFFHRHAASVRNFICMRCDGRYIIGASPNLHFFTPIGDGGSPRVFRRHSRVGAAVGSHGRRALRMDRTALPTTAFRYISDMKRETVDFVMPIRV